jgi:hypothetical protein
MKMKVQMKLLKFQRTNVNGIGCKKASEAKESLLSQILLIKVEIASKSFYDYIGSLKPKLD